MVGSTCGQYSIHDSDVRFLLGGYKGLTALRPVIGQSGRTVLTDGLGCCSRLAAIPIFSSAWWSWCIGHVHDGHIVDSGQ